MSKNTQVSNAAANAEADALSALLATGYLRLYTTAQPANADTAVSGQTLLSEHRFSATAAPAAAAGVITFNAITTVAAGNSGTATWFRALKSDGTTVVMDGTVGTIAAATENLQLNSNVISGGANVSITGFTHTVNKATAGL